ncbi:MAG: hypothetical protein M3Y53_04005 [Thermoproteota archaeon]|nr:hypothetical protein [Thermoproteota archaeon]
MSGADLAQRIPVEKSSYVVLPPTSLTLVSTGEDFDDQSYQSSRNYTERPSTDRASETDVRQMHAPGRLESRSDRRLASSGCKEKA